MTIAKKATAKKTATKSTAQVPAKKAIAKKAVAKKVAAKKVAMKKAASHEEIATLARTYWSERGHHHGQHVEDWLRAERKLNG